MHLAKEEVLNRPLLSTMNFLNEITYQYPTAISFAPGRPSEQCFHVPDSIEALTYFVDVQSHASKQSRVSIFNQLGQYQRTNGIINDLVCQFLANDEHIYVDPTSIMIVDGCQEAMNILLTGLFEPGQDVLLVSDPTYVGIAGIASLLGIELCPIPCGWQGFNFTALTTAIQEVRSRGKTPRALYLIPDFNNPLGTCMSMEERHRLLTFAAEHDLLLLEDNAYGMFAYNTPRLPTLKALDTTRCVIYLGTFSKILFPSLRIGFLVADQILPHSSSHASSFLAEQLSKVKSFTTVNTSSLLQAILGGILLKNQCSFQKMIQEKIVFYRGKRDAMVQSLVKHFTQDQTAENITWSYPQGGFFLSVHLPFVFTAEMVHLCAREFGVICCPMSFFALTSGYENQVRLSFSYVTEEEIEEGILRFHQFVQTCREKGAVCSV